MEKVIDPGYSLFREAIDAYKNGSKLTDDFHRRAADLMLSNLSEYRCRPLPTAPTVVQDLHQKRIGDKEYAVKDEFWRQGGVWGWLEQRDKIVAQNRGSYGLLLMLHDKPFLTLPEREKVLSMIKEFTSFFDEECKRADYTPLIPQEEQKQEPVVITDEIQEVADIFGGEVL